MHAAPWGSKPHTHSLTHSLSHTQSLSHTLSHTHTLSLSLTHTHSLSLTHTHTPITYLELKADAKGKKEFEDYQTKLEIQKADLKERIEKNKAWVVSYNRKYFKVMHARRHRRKPATAQSPLRCTSTCMSACFDVGCCPCPCVQGVLDTHKQSICISHNQANFERNSDNGAFEEQYRRLVEEISSIYADAKEFHKTG